MAAMFELCHLRNTHMWCHASLGFAGLMHSWLNIAFQLDDLCCRLVLGYEISILLWLGW